MTIVTKKYILCIFLSSAELTRWIIDLDNAFERDDALFYFKTKIIQFRFQKVENLSSQKKLAGSF